MAAIEPARGEGLFLYKTFSHINSMVEEIEEFKDFNYTLENDTLEDELDKEIFDDNTTDKPVKKKRPGQKERSIRDLSEEGLEDFYVKEIRK